MHDIYGTDIYIQHYTAERLQAAAHMRQMAEIKHLTERHPEDNRSYRLEISATRDHHKPINFVLIRIGRS